MKNIFTLFLCLFFALNAFAQGTLSGLVTDKETGEPILFGDVAIYKSKSLITGTQTDFDGNYTIVLEAGSYDLKFTYVSYYDFEVKNVLISDENIKNIDVELKPGKIRDFGFSCGSYKIPLMQMDAFGSGQTFTAEDIEKMPLKN